MGVASPVKTLLVAHLQATWNRSIKEMAKTGNLVLTIALAVLVCFAVIPAVAGGIALGYTLTKFLSSSLSPFFLSGVLIFLALLGGAGGGIFGGSRVLEWESTRVFPLKHRSLFVAELVAGLGDPLPLITAMLSGALLLGAALAKPFLLPLLLFMWVGTVVSQLCFLHLLGSLTARLVKRLQVGLMFLGVIFYLSTLLTPLAKSPNSLPEKAYASKDVTIETILRIGKRVRTMMKPLPPVQAALGLGDADKGRWDMALGRQLYPLGFLAMLLSLTAWVLKRDADPQHFRVQSKGKERLWSFGSPLGGVARLHWQTLISSPIGKVGMLTPLFLIVLIHGPFSRIKGLQYWSLPVAFIFLVMSNAKLQLNQFAMDGSGVKALFLLPLRARDLLQGKLWGLALFQSVQAVILLLLLSLGGNLSPLRVLAALCLAAILFLVQTGLGHWTSVWMPRPMSRDSLRNTNQSFAVILIGLACSCLGASCFGGIFYLCAWLAPAMLLPVMVLLLGSIIVLYYRVILPVTARYLDQQREVVVKALS